MKRQHEKAIIKVKVFLDAVMIGAAFLVSFELSQLMRLTYRSDVFGGDQFFTAPAYLSQYLPSLFLWIPIWMLMFYLNGKYRSFRRRSLADIFFLVARTAVMSFLCFGGVAFLLKIQFFSRFFTVIFLVIACIFLVAEQQLLILFSRRIWRKGYDDYNILIVGTGRRAGDFIKTVKDNPDWGYKILGLLDQDEERVGQTFYGVEVIEHLWNLKKILLSAVVDEVFFIVPRLQLHALQPYITLCELLGIKASVAANFYDLKIARVYQEEITGQPFMTFAVKYGMDFHLFLKRLIDIFGSLTAMVLASPILVTTAIMVKLTSPGPVFFMQKRKTLNGRVFIMYKFRSMYKDAEQKLVEYMHLNEMDGPVFKIKDDPRITPIGKFIRKTSIDELPQLYNVLIGDMSLVGPRPPIPYEVTKYKIHQIRRLSMRGGITCLWQIRGRNMLSFDKWMEYDLEYIDNWSLLLDIKILLQTIPVVLFGSGAR
ncbi:MAG: sugar transferase [Candidatus Omnitrophica bacterium]|nr:sugar transferase [Candidatus Omnitrophota bacterium]